MTAKPPSTPKATKKKRDAAAEDAAFLARYDASRYPRPSVAVDVVALTVEDGQLRVALYERTEPPQRGAVALPGGFVKMDESLDDAAVRLLQQKAGFSGVFVEQLYTFGDVRRDPRGRVITVAYYALIDAQRFHGKMAPHARHARIVVPWPGETGGPVDVLDDAGKTLPLAFDHEDILGLAVKRLRGKLDYTPVGFQLLPAEFTLRQLQEIHEAVRGDEVNKDSFRRRMLTSGLIEATGARERDVLHRPAELYRFIKEERRMKNRASPPPASPVKQAQAIQRFEGRENTMAEIRSYVVARHIRTEPTTHVLFFRGGEVKRKGRGLAFWFQPLGASIAQVPLDDRELPFLFQGRSSDFQDVAVNGVVTFRVHDPELLAARVDFSIDTRTGLYNKEPLDKLALVVRELSQQLASTFLNKAPLRLILDQGIEVIRDAIHTGLVNDKGIASLGLEIVATRISSVKPTSEMEKALQMPTRERIQQEADEATFGRRALAVDKERAIQENELSNQIELARREEQLIAQRGQNERKRATELAESKRIEAEAAAKNVKLNAEAQAQSIKVLEESKVNAERDRMEIYRDLPPAALMGLAARELAGKLQNIEHLSLTPDILGSLLQRVLGAQADKLEGQKGHDAE